MSNASIGAIGAPYFDEINDRTKAFLLKMHGSAAEIETSLQKALQQESRGPRITMRVWAHERLSLEELQSISALDLEAVVPVEGVGQIVYYGCNLSTRKSSAQILREQELLLEKIRERPARDCRLLPGFSLCFRQSDGQDFSDQDVQDLVKIYQQTFDSYLVELNAEAVQGMLEGNWVAVVRNPEDRIVAVVMAEIATIEVAGQQVRLAEISEVATHPDYQRRGLARAAYWKILRALRHEGVQAVFTEARANHYAIMAVAWDVGLRPRGTLHKHCVISSGYSEVAQSGSYGDLVVFS